MSLLSTMSYGRHKYTDKQIRDDRLKTLPAAIARGRNVFVMNEDRHDTEGSRRDYLSTGSRTAPVEDRWFSGGCCAE